MNEFSTFDTSDLEPYTSLTQLYINENNISDWNEVIKLGHLFPNLSQLIMIGNPITDLHSTQDAADICGKAFPNLSIINVTQTLLTGWDVIEKFRNFPSLSDLRITGLPFLDVSIGNLKSHR